MRRSVSKKFFSFIKSVGDPKLRKLGLKNRNVVMNASSAELYELGLTEVESNTRSSVISNEGALCAYSGQRTGRAPKDHRVVVKSERTKHTVEWGDVNIPVEEKTYELLEEIAVGYLNTKPKIYYQEGYVGWDKKYRKKVKAITSRAYHSLFLKNMLVQPTFEEHLTDFKDKNADFYIINAGELDVPIAGNIVKDLDSKICIASDFEHGKIVVLGTQYAGDMRKGLMGMVHYALPEEGLLTMHASANVGSKGDVMIFFGISRTGKSYLSTQENRSLLADDALCWSSEGVFNLEGGCYSRCLGICPLKQKEIFESLKFGTLLENVTFHDEKERIINFHDASITENTRACYPLQYINRAKLPAVAQHPKNIVLLTCDAFGVLPPVSMLNHDQALYYFLAGYSSKLVLDENNKLEPVPTFTSCFGENFLPKEPKFYVQLFDKYLNRYKPNVWLVNTGWQGGMFGEGERIKPEHTLSIIKAIQDGRLNGREFDRLKMFNLSFPIKCEGINVELDPRKSWDNMDNYEDTLEALAGAFADNFNKFDTNFKENIVKSGPSFRN